MPAWQPSERAAAVALQAEMLSPAATAAVAEVEAMPPRAGAGAFPPLFRDYKYES